MISGPLGGLLTRDVLNRIDPSRIMAERPFGVRFLPRVTGPCLRFCCIVVNGANADQARFQRDVARANQVWRSCGIRMVETTFATVDDAALLDHPDWDCTSAATGDTARLLQMRGSCADADVMVFYVRSIGSNLAGCGGSGLANGRPGIVMTDRASRNTFPHEIGHIYLGGNSAHSSDKNNVMYTPSGNITADPPQTITTQCDTARPSTRNTRCSILPLLVMAAAPTSPMVSAMAAATAAPRSLRELLQTDEGEGLAVVVSMGQAAIPQLTMLLSDPDPQVRAGAAAALAQIAGVGALPALQRLVQADPDPVVRLVTANRLSRFAGAAAEPVLAVAVQDRDVGVRLTAVRSLVWIGTMGARTALAQAAMREPVPQVRDLALRLTQMMGG